MRGQKNQRFMQRIGKKWHNLGPTPEARARKAGMTWRKYYATQVKKSYLKKRKHMKKALYKRSR